MKKDLTRTDAASLNLRTSVAGIFIGLVFSFFSRKIFVLVLGKEFVGLGSLIGNMTAVLSLLDFGASSAVIYRLYKPLSQKDHHTVSSLLYYFGLLCRFSAVLTAAAGLLVMPHLPSIVEDFGDKNTLFAVFAIYVLSNSAGYFFMRERVLLFADQKNYISQLFSYLFGAVTVLCESAVLLATKNYIAYLSVHTVLCIGEDIFLSVYVRKNYPEISFSGKKYKNPAVRKALFLEMAALQPSNIAGTLLRTADNFLVVQLFGVAANGVYSNYNMLLSYASMLSVTLIGAISASVGNLSASASEKRAEKVFGMTSLACFFLVNICTTVLFVLAEDIITAWLGAGLALPMSVSLILAAHFFINGLRRSTLIFRDGYGLYKKERIKPFLELVSSLVLSVFFGKKLGIGGVYLGQAASSFFICLWYEPYILYKHGFGKGAGKYYLKMLKYSAVTLFSCICSYSLCRFVPSLSLSTALCCAVSTLFAAGAFWGSEEMKEAVERLKNNSSKIKKRRPSANI